mgnify:FL=1
MFKTFIGKFTFFFWLVFFVINIPTYIFGTVYFKNILKASEQEKIMLIVDTLKPIIALNLSFNQEEQLDDILNTLLAYENIKRVELLFENNKKNILKVNGQNHSNTLFVYESDIIDTFDKNVMAKINLEYSSKNINNIQAKIIAILFFTFIFTLIIFAIFYVFVRSNLNALRKISNALQEYSDSENITPIILQNKSEEINTIANVANKMIANIDQYVQKLQSFNSELSKQVQQEVRKQQEQEQLMIHQSRQAAMGEMIESIAHQWRQPLNIIGLAIVNLETNHAFGIRDDKNFEDKLELITLNVRYMSNTIDDFRNFLNPDREIVEFNPQNSIQDVLKIVDAQLKNNNISYEFNSNAIIKISGVENEFTQVLFILINNAKDAIKTLIDMDTIKKGSLTINVYEKDEHGFIEIIDNGGGIPQEILDKIFDPYFTTKFASQGTGIGLHIAKNIVETRMKGSLVAQNIEKGCRFTIKLPLTISKDM